MKTDISMPIIGYMQSPYQEKFGIPRQPNLVQVESYIEMCAPYNDEAAFVGITAFSHLWLIWHFHDNKHAHVAGQFRAQVRPPRLGGNKKMGIFATRSMYRPAPMGLSVVKFVRLEKKGQVLRLYVSGSDLLNHTPILDIKPYIQYSDAIVDAQSGYAQDQPLRKQVIWSDEAKITQYHLLEQQLISVKLCAELEQVLSLDPRPAYQNEADRIYKMKFADLDVSFNVMSDTIEIVDIVVI